MRGLNIFKLVLWIIKKVQTKCIYFYRGRFNLKYYPEEILELLNKSMYSNPNMLAVNPLDLKNISNTKVPIGLNLASEKVPISNSKINFSSSFVDPEDEENLHRWNWLMQIVTSKSCSQGEYLWGIKMQLEWVQNFQHEFHKPISEINTLLRWESYTVGERISNSVLFYTFTNITPPTVIQSALIEQVQFLSNRLEYFGKNTGNHVLNNARSIYLAGTFFNYDPWKKIAASIIKIELPKLVTKDGFLREGSSHYQFLFTRWILEVLYFSKIGNDERFTNYLSPYTNDLLNKCLFFSITNAYQNLDIPLFGDISPDFPPQWLNNLVNIYDLNHTQQNGVDNSWANLINNAELNICENIKYFNKMDYQGSGTYTYLKSGWYRFNYKNKILLMHAEPKGVSNHVGHQHHDAGHFCLYHNGFPVFVDSGRFTYSNSYGISPKAHNTIMVNKLGLVPDKPERYPLEYSNCCDSITSHEMGEVVFKSNGFSRLNRNILWERKLNFSDNRFSIQDTVDGNGEYEVITYFHFNKDIKIKNKSNDVFLVSCHSFEAKLKIDLQTPYSINIHFGGGSPLGWQCVAYGNHVPAYTLEIVRKVELPENTSLTMEWV